MNKQDKIKKVNELASMVGPLFTKIDEAYASSMDLISVNFLEKYYLNNTKEEVQDIHNQWAEDNSELRHTLKDLRKFIKHIDILPEDSFVTKDIRNNIKWNVSQVWEIITENFTIATADLIKVGKEKWEVDFLDVKPIEILERIQVVNDDELETHIFRTFTETNATKGSDNAIHLVTDWWIDTPVETYFLSGQSDMKNKISFDKLDKELSKLKNDKESFIQLDLFSMTYTIKLVVLSDIIRLISIYMKEYWNDETVEIISKAIIENDDLWASLNSEVWEEQISIITKNLEEKDSNGKELEGIWTVVAKKNEFFGKLMNKLGIKEIHNKN